MPHRIHVRKTFGAWRSVTGAVAVTAVAAATPALAQAHFAPGDVATPQLQTHSSSAYLNQLDELGPKYVTIHRRSVPTAPTNGSPRGFHWREAGAGLGGAVLALALLALIRRKRRATQPEQGRLAGI